MDVEPTEEDRYFQGWWASSVQFGDRWKERSARLRESARKAPFSCLYEALALECLCLLYTSFQAVVRHGQGAGAAEVHAAFPKQADDGMLDDFRVHLERGNRLDVYKRQALRTADMELMFFISTLAPNSFCPWGRREIFMRC